MTLSPVMASERSECGMACVVMVANAHGHDVDLLTLREHYPISSTGMRLPDLVSVLDGLGIASRALRVELEGLNQISTPAVLHWNFNHFVVLEKATARHAVIVDPSSGRRQIPLSELSHHFTGVVLETEPRPELTPLRARRRVSLRRLLSHLPGLGPLVGQIVVLSAVAQAMALAPPFFIKTMIDGMLAFGGGELLTVVALGLGVALLGQALIAAFRDWAVQHASAQIAYHLNATVLSHLLRLPAAWFERRLLGDVLARLQSIQALRSLLSNGLAMLLIDGAAAVLMVGVMLMYSTTLTVGVIILALAALGVALGTAHYSRERTERALVAMGREQSHVVESMRAISTLKVMAKEPLREAAWRNLAIRRTNAEMAVGLVGLFGSNVQIFLNGLQTILVLGGGAFLVSLDRLTPGELIAFFMFAQMFSGRAGTVARQLGEIRVARLHIERLSDILNESAEPLSAPAGLEIKGAIEFRSVAFRYGLADRPLFEDLDLRIEAGEFVAIVGPSGEGKSTLIKLMLGLVRPTAGELRLDGRPPDPAIWAAWRKRLGVVSQEDSLLSGSIRDNISFWDDDADIGAIAGAARSARLADEIEAMPMRYQTPIGDMGSALSAGQKQRLLLARALYRQPSVLILDEGTANLDQANEQQIMDIVASLDITRVVVTHKMELARRADRILEVRNGEVLTLYSKPTVDAA